MVGTVLHQPNEEIGTVKVGGAEGQPVAPDEIQKKTLEVPSEVLYTVAGLAHVVQIPAPGLAALQDLDAWDRWLIEGVNVLYGPCSMLGVHVEIGRNR